MLEKLFPDEKKFFARFTEIAEHLSRAARLLEEGFEQPARWAELSGRIELVEQEADDTSHAVDTGTERMFIPPMDREDIHLLSTALRRTVDTIGGTARRAVSLRATDRREPAVQLARTLVRATEEIEQAVAHIKDSRLVLERTPAIKQCEEEGDGIHAQAVSALFDGTPDPIEVLRWKTLYDQLEEALDACEDVANELETVTVKHS
ncbi:MAG TPA: DUF47 family protein [Gemmatimonadales bacterium]|nr:DUF47 family protein [Gemmatimonadales bacterium]